MAGRSIPRQNRGGDVRDYSRQFAMVPLDVIEVVKDAKALALYCILKKYANQQTRQAHPSRSTLASHMGYKTPRPVDEALEHLKGLGLVRTYPRFRDDDGNIAYRKDEQFREQTSNGYEIYDTPLGQDTPLWPTGHNPHSPQAMTPMAQGLHEPDPLEPDPREPESEGASAPAAAAAPPTPRKKQAHELPENWRPDPHVWEQMAKQRPDVDLELEHAKFCDYWPSQPGSRSRKKDWNATWRNWIRNARPSQGSGGKVENTLEAWGFVSEGSNLPWEDPAPTFDDTPFIDHQEVF